jgi:hypothetical protein
MAANIPINISAQGTVHERTVPVSECGRVEFSGPDGFVVKFLKQNPFGGKPIDWQNRLTDPCHHIPGVKQYPYSVSLHDTVTDPTPDNKPPGPIIVPPPPVGPGSRKRR